MGIRESYIPVRALFVVFFLARQEYKEACHSGFQIHARSHMTDAGARLTGNLIYKATVIAHDRDTKTYICMTEYDFKPVTTTTTPSNIKPRPIIQSSTSILKRASAYT